MRLTEQRKVIMNNLKNRCDHPTADDIYVSVRKSLPKISLGTIYRNLEMMSRTGMIESFDVGDGVKRFDADISSHEHFICQDCGKIEDLPSTGFLADLPEIWTRDKQISGYQLQIFGRCINCKRNN